MIEVDATDRIDMAGGIRVQPVYSDERASPRTAFQEALTFRGKCGEAALLPDGDGVSLAVGMGDREAATLSTLKSAVAAALGAARGIRHLRLDLLEGWQGSSRREAVTALAESLVLASYSFDRYQPKGREWPTRFSIPSSDPARDRPCAALGAEIAGAVCLARDLVNLPSSALGPLEMVEESDKVASRTGLELRVFDQTEIDRRGMGALSAVGGAGDSPSRLIELTYTPPDHAGATLALVGKGITFDSGGLSIKTAAQMEWMKNDMAGAAAVLGAMSLLRYMNVQCRVIGILACAENLPGPGAMRPGDVIRASDGTSIEVINTDAEGRLVLADGIAHARSLGVDAVVDIATLTGSVQVALGPNIAGLFGNNGDLVRQVWNAAETAGEEVWPMPLPRRYAKMLESPIAQLRNIGTGPLAGALTAGLFLEHFASDTPWAHLDIDGPAMIAEDEPCVPQGGTGFGVKTLAAVAKSFSVPARGPVTWASAER